MSIKSSQQLKNDANAWKSDPLDTTIGNSNPVLLPDAQNNVLTQLLNIIIDVIDSKYNKADKIAISDVVGLVSALAGKQDSDATILKQANIINNLISTSAIQPLSAAQGKVLKDLIDAIHAQNSDTILDQGNANEISALELRTHVNDLAKHFTQAQIDHTVILNKGVNTHAQIDSHIADATLHYPQTSISHLNIQDTGTNTHAQIDAHLASTLNPHGVTIGQAISAASLSFTKGTIYVANGSSVVALAPGANGLSLKTNSATVSGLEWSSDNGEANTISSVGTGASLVQGKSGVDLQIRSVSSSTPTTLSISNIGSDTVFTLNVGAINHQNLGNVGTNTHAQIDAHIANTSNPHNVTIDQVSPTTTKGDIMVDNGGSVVRFAAGTNGQVLVADSTTATGLRYSSDLITVIAHTTDTNNPHNVTINQSISEAGLPLTKGTIYVANGTSIVALPVGVNGTVLKANSATLSGLEFSADSGEVNTASNLAGSGVGFFASKSSADLRFRTLNSVSPSLTFTINGNQVDAAIVPSLLNHQDLNGAGTNTHTQIDAHISNTANPHNVTKTQVGLSNVPNVDATNCDNHVDGVTNVVFTSANRSKLNAIAANATNNPQQAALTASLGTLSQAGSFTPDYAIQALTNTSAWGFATQDEAESVLSVIINMQLRINQLETRLQAAGILN